MNKKNLNLIFNLRINKLLKFCLKKEGYVFDKYSIKRTFDIEKFGKIWIQKNTKITNKSNILTYSLFLLFVVERVLFRDYII